MAAAADAKQTGLRKKLGPLPVWAWALLLLAVAAWFLFRHSSPAAATSQDAGQASGSSFPSSGDSSGGGGGAGVDPSLLAALAQQNSTLEQGLLDAFRGIYSGSYSATSASGAAPAGDGVGITLTASQPMATTPSALAGDTQVAPVTSTYSYTPPAVITQPVQIPSASPFASNTDTSGGPADQIARGSVGGGASSSDVVPFNQTILARQVTPETSPSNPTPALSAARGATGKGQVLQ